jgi:hypothetical protein
LKIANEFFIPLITLKLNKSIKKQEMRLYCMLLSVTYSVLSHFQSPNNVDKTKDFTQFYLKDRVSKEVLAELEITQEKLL